MKTWMIQGGWQINNGMVLPVRAMAEAKTKKEAEKKAPEAVRAAVRSMTGTNHPPGKPFGDPMVLYAM